MVPSFDALDNSSAIKKRLGFVNKFPLLLTSRQTRCNASIGFFKLDSKDSLPP